MLQNKDEINYWLKDRGIKRFTISDDLTVDVNDCVSLYDHNLDIIPVRFGRVDDYFDCSRNNLRSLKGSPKSVGGTFLCNDNKLTCLEGVPQHIPGSFHCDSNLLSSLKFCPIEIGGSFNCANNFIENFKYAPSKVGKDFDCQNNPGIDFLDLKCEIGDLFIYDSVLLEVLIKNSKCIRIPTRENLTPVFEINGKDFQSIITFYKLNAELPHNQSPNKKSKI